MGSEYVLSGEIDPEYTSQIAQYVNSKMKELHDRTVGMSSTRLAVLTAMNIADELFTLRSSASVAEHAGHARIVELENRLSTWLQELDAQQHADGTGSES